MNRYVRVLIGVLLGLAFMAAAVDVFGYFAIRSPFSLASWTAHPGVVMYASEALAFLPLATLLGIILSKLFKDSPVRSALISMVIAFVISFAAGYDEPAAIMGVLTDMPLFWVSFVLGVPTIVYWLCRERSKGLGSS